ncbi:TIGR04104 family putative zinc finger protein [Salisediminibacterium beveridgei]|uniref:Cxxc_20_cxxc protein n=1 Tax=Salisediminibacterium beveridgei TaxID=632773 RepID=A0A1D7QZJ6_9BACI|nr:TIGR04104 family putative zinc finger protein [Salisediminibacterium beveridgei]AOM84429.1 hypothetical protein BBEV_3112 [Salisediminibacterium beveridgei]
MKFTLPVCDSCRTPLTWKQALVAQRFIKEYTSCPTCQEKQFVKARKDFLILTLFIALFPLLLNVFTDLAIFHSIILYAVIIILLVILSPFTYTLNTEDTRTGVNQNLFENKQTKK